MEYKRLGDYIREVNVRNKDLKVTNPMGINIEKYFMPSVANVIGTDLSAYKMVGDMQFACNLMHVGRDEKIPMAMHKGEQPLIVSPAYFVFENSKPNELLSDYLMMWFRRPEFDRSAWFYTDADVRGGMTKDALLDMTLLVPSIDRQREIVEEYETLSRRIRLNEQMIEKLENAGVRCELDDRSEKIGFKIRAAQMEKIPYMLLVGDKDIEAGTISVRSRKNGDEGAVTIEDFIKRIQMEINNKS